MASFNEYVTTITQDYFLPKVVDNILNSNVAAVRWLSKQKQWAGEQLKVIFKYKKSASGGSFALDDTFDTGRTNTRKLLKFDPKFMYQGITLFGPEVSVNQLTKSQIVDLVKTETESAQDDMMDNLGDMVYGIGAGNDIMGIDGIIDDGTNLATYGELSRTDYAQIRSTTTDANAAMTIALIAANYDGAKNGNKVPTLAITTEALWTKYESLITPQISANYDLVGGSKVTRAETVRPGATLGEGQTGFEALMFRGKPIVADEKCPSGTMFWINENFLDFYGLKAAWYSAINLSGGTIEGGYYDSVPEKNFGFSWSGWKEPVNQYARTAQIILMGNFVSGGPRNHAKQYRLS